MGQSTKKEIVSINVPDVGGAEVGAAIDMVEQLVEKYGISPVDADALFNGMVAIYIRQRVVFRDRAPAVCSLAECMGGAKA